MPRASQCTGTAPTLALRAKKSQPIHEVLATDSHRRSVETKNRSRTDALLRDLLYAPSGERMYRGAMQSGSDIALALYEERAKTLGAAFDAHPKRFKRNCPQLPKLPVAVWINSPKRSSTSVRNHSIAP